MIAKTQTWGLGLSQSLQGAGGVGGLLSVEELSGTHTGVYHFAFDANGNATEVLDALGGIAAHYEYSPFGEVIRSSGIYADVNTFRFSTKYLDVETGLYYYGYRHYDPARGRWLSKDPIQEQGGLNLYGMVGNDPINRFDLWGLQGSRCGWSPPGADEREVNPSEVIKELPIIGPIVELFDEGEKQMEAGDKRRQAMEDFAKDPSAENLERLIKATQDIGPAAAKVGVKGAKVPGTSMTDAATRPKRL